MSRSTLFVQVGLNLDSLVADQCFGVEVYELPFRLRTGAYFAADVSVRGAPVRLAVVNPLELQRPEDVDAAFARDEMFTRHHSYALAHFPLSEVSAERLASIRATKGESLRQAWPTTGHSTFTGIEALNKLLIAYSHAGRQFFGGGRLQLLGQAEAVRALRWTITVLHDASAVPNREDFLAWLKPQLETPMGSSVQLTGDFHDLDAEVLSGIPALLDEQEQHAYLELAFDSRSRLVARDWRAALVMAVAALESAHASMVQDRLSTRLKAEDSSRRAATDFIRSVSISKALDVSPALFLSAEEQPDKYLLGRVKRALTLRNEIVHAAAGKDGRWKAQQTSSEELSSATVAVLDLAEHFIRCVRGFPLPTASESSKGMFLPVTVRTTDGLQARVLPKK